MKQGPHRVDWTGKRIGSWTVVAIAPTKNHQSRWLCRCDCGIEKEIETRLLKKGTAFPCKKCNWMPFLPRKPCKFCKPCASRLYTVDGISLTMKEWAKKLGISVEGLRMRKKKGWTLEETLTIPHIRRTDAKYRGTKIVIAGVLKSIRGWSRAFGVSRITIDNMLADGRLEEISKLIEEAKDESSCHS